MKRTQTQQLKQAQLETKQKAEVKPQFFPMRTNVMLKVKFNSELVKSHSTRKQEQARLANQQKKQAAADAAAALAESRRLAKEARQKAEQERRRKKRETRERDGNQTCCQRWRQIMSGFVGGKAKPAGQTVAAQAPISAKFSIQKCQMIIIVKTSLCRLENFKSPNSFKPRSAPKCLTPGTEGQSSGSETGETSDNLNAVARTKFRAQGTFI